MEKPEKDALWALLNWMVDELSGKGVTIPDWVDQQLEVFLTLE